MNRKFQLPADPKTTSKSIRFPDEVIAQVEEVIKGTGLSFSKFVVAATKAALEDLKEEEDG